MTNNYQGLETLLDDLRSFYDHVFHEREKIAELEVDLDILIGRCLDRGATQQAVADITEVTRQAIAQRHGGRRGRG